MMKTLSISKPVAFSALGLALGLALGAAGMSAEAAGNKPVRSNPNTGPVRVNPQPSPANPGLGFAVPFQASCVNGFTLAKHQKKNAYGDHDWTDYYVCTTQLITCPKQVQADGRTSRVNAQAIVQQIGGDPDGGVIKFRVQYKCDYSYNVPPEG